MASTLTLSAKPEVLPITRDEAKAFLRVDFTNDDDIIEAFIEAATDYAQEELWRQLITATYIYKLDEFPPDGSWIELPKAPLQSVTSITYLDENGASQTWSTSDYQVSTSEDRPGRVLPLENGDYPDTQSETFETVTITYVAGYGEPESVPGAIKNAIKMIVAHLYENRDSVSVSPTNVNQIPFPEQINFLLQKYSLKEML